jgi:phage N-6-adenine-methyltransferase
MANFDNNRFASNNQEYETPWELFNKCNEEFHFTLDVCANEKNHKLDNYINEETDSLKQTWDGSCWMNPPYKDMKQWIIKAYNESRKEGTTVVCLIPARTNTNWWHEYCMKGEIRFIKGRPKFEGCVHGLPQPLALVIFGTDYTGNYTGFTY